MTTTQRMKNDTATMDKREMADKAVSDNRNKNDNITVERRSKADTAVEKSRIRNDELTADRREIKDEKVNTVIAMSILIGLAAGVTLMLI